MMETQLVS